MKVKIQVLIFVFFMVLTAFLFRYVSGPFYLGNNSDPSYFYLYNFLYVLEGKPLQFFEHPGTPLDILGALVVKIFFPAQPNTLWLQTNLPRAEEVLGLVWFLMVMMYAATLAALGFYVYKKSQDSIFTGLVLLGSLWLIMVPSYTAQGILPISANVNAETIMMIAVNLMLWAVLRFYFSPDTKSISHAISLGAAVAFVLATKFTALPFLFVAFCLFVTWPQRIVFCAVVAGGFIVLTFPIWSIYPRLWSWWVVGLIVDKGLHANGGQGFDAAAYIRNFLIIIKSHYFFAAEWSAAGIIAFTRQVDSKIRRILLGVAIGGAVQILIVSKQMQYHYMAPMIGLSSLVLPLVYKAFPGWWHRGLKFFTAVIAAVSLGLIVLSVWQIHEKTRKSWQMLHTIARDYAQYQVCPFYRSSMPGFGYVFWNNMLRDDDYGAILKKYYPRMYFYDLFGHDFKDSAGQIVPLAWLKQQGPVLIYGSDQDIKGFAPNLTVEKIYGNGLEALYEPISIQSDRGVEFLQYAMFMYAHGNYQNALRAALMSQQLGVGQDLGGFINLLKQKVQGP